MPVPAKPSLALVLRPGDNNGPLCSTLLSQPAGFNIGGTGLDKPDHSPANAFRYKPFCYCRWVQNVRGLKQSITTCMAGLNAVTKPPESTDMLPDRGSRHIEDPAQLRSGNDPSPLAEQLKNLPVQGPLYPFPQCSSR